MGTRHLIEVKVDGEIKVAQYGQWDGYPTGQGETIARFLKDANLGAFKDAVRECRWMTDAEMGAINDRVKATNFQWRSEMPWLSRDAGAEILWHVARDGARVLKDSRDFKEDKLMCEFHYLIDLDAETVTMNGSLTLPFREWTKERMKEIEKSRSEEANA